ncbi:MAG: glycoside hydrolase family 88 protein [Promethearchaeota archaeon]
MLKKFIIKKIAQFLNFKYFPHYTQNGKWLFTKDGYWTGGFSIGLLLYAYTFSKNCEYKEKAIYYMDLLKKRVNDQTFDLGFLFYPSFVYYYRLREDKIFKEIALKAANTLCSLFDRKIGIIYEKIKYDSRIYGKMIIDIMMNLPLLWWAYKETNEKKFYYVANTHSRRTLEILVRNDFSTYHGALIDLRNREIMKKITFQGLHNESCWSRGQAWAIFGFIKAFRHTKSKNFLNAATKLAEYFLKKLPEDLIPYWDFNIKNQNDKYKDSSAASICACGLLELYKFTKDEKFLNNSRKILKSLESNYLNRNFTEDGILNHCCFHKPKNLGVDCCSIWGDYYFLKAILNLKKLKNPN